MIYVKELAEIIVKQGLMMEALQRDISEVVKQRDERIKHADDLADQLLDKTLEAQSLQDSNNALAADNNRRQEREQSLASDNESLRQFNTELTNRFQALQQGNVDLSNKVAELELKASDLKFELQWMTKDRDYLSEIINSAVVKLSDPTNTSSNREIIAILQPKAQQ